MDRIEPAQRHRVEDRTREKRTRCEFESVALETRDVGMGGADGACHRGIEKSLDSVAEQGIDGAR